MDTGERSVEIGPALMAAVCLALSPRQIKDCCSGAENQTAGDHIVESLLFFCDAGKDVADSKRDEAGDEFGEVAARGATEGNAIALKIGDDEVHHFFPDRALPVGAFKIGTVKPAQNQAPSNQETKGRGKCGDDGWIGRVISIETMERCPDTSQKE